MANLRAIFQAGFGTCFSWISLIWVPVRVVGSSTLVEAWAGEARMSPAAPAARTMAIRDRGLSFHTAGRVS
jgi:hypothetical protein